jgi:hypothetical protein
MTALPRRLSPCPPQDDGDTVPVLLPRNVITWLHRLARHRGTSWYAVLDDAILSGVELQARAVLDEQARSRA